MRDAQYAMSSIWIPLKWTNAAFVMPKQNAILSVWIPLRWTNAASVMPACLHPVMFERVKPLEMHKVGVDDRGVDLWVVAPLDRDIRLRRAREARAPPAHVPTNARLHVRPRENRDGISKLGAHEPQRARLPRIEEAEDALPYTVSAREHREDRRSGAIRRGERHDAHRATPLTRACLHDARECVCRDALEEERIKRIRHVVRQTAA